MIFKEQATLMEACSILDLEQQEELILAVVNLETVTSLTKEVFSISLQESD